MRLDAGKGNESLKTVLALNTFNNKYKHQGCETWADLASTLVNDVCGDLEHIIPKDGQKMLIQIITDMKFIPGGRYLYYAGRNRKFFNNCYLLRAEEDTREDWAYLSQKSETCLMTGGGIGIDYSVYRPSGSVIHSTGGIASGPIPKMSMINEIGRNVMQGGSRRSAIYASLNWQHDDTPEFLTIKNWDDLPAGSSGLSMGDLKRQDFNFNCPLDMTNISVNYDTDWIMDYFTTGDVGGVFRKNCLQACSTGEPGFSFNFFDKEKETLRNACTEVSSEDDSDVCNLGSINFARIDSIDDLVTVVDLSTRFLLCGTLKAELPYDKVYRVREKNRRLGLGIMGVHEWLLMRRYPYEVVPELHQWLKVYEGVSDHVSKNCADRASISVPVANRAVAPTGTIGMLAATTTGIEPLYSVAYKRRYITGGNKYKYQYEIDLTAQHLIEEHGIDPEHIDSALSLSTDVERRIKFQADIQNYVDMGISSTINLPSWGSDSNNEDTVPQFTSTLAKYAKDLRGITFYPDGARGGQPITTVSYEEAKGKLGQEFEDNLVFNDVCDITNRGGSCGT